MTGQQTADTTAIYIRTARWNWISMVGVGLLYLGLAVLWIVLVRHWPPIGWMWLALGYVNIAQAMWIRTRGIVLTPSTAEVHSLRRHSVPWPDVQAVIPHHRFDGWRVRLITADGQQLTLRAPVTSLGLGQERFDRDFHQIGQWWLAHRGQSWQPVRPEAPRPA